MEELGAAFKTFKLSDDAATFMQRADVDADGTIEFAELASYLANHERRLKVVFDSLDADRDGGVTAAEIGAALAAKGIHVDAEESQRLLGKLDKDNSLEISWEEWRDRMIWQPHAELEEIVNYWRKSTFIDIGDNLCVPDDFSAKEMKTGMWWRQLVAGGVAGAVSRTSTAPLDRLKVTLQVHGSAAKAADGGKPSILGILRGMVAEGGVKSLWRGNGVNVVKIAPESALKFMAYERFKTALKGGAESKKELAPWERMIAGSSAGALAQTVIYPMELIKTRLAVAKTGQYKGMLDVAVQCLRQEGPKAFYKGYLPNILGIIPYAGIDLTVYEMLKAEYARRHPGEEKPGILSLLLCGTASSTCGQLASYPLALVRTRMQAASGSSLGATQLFLGILKNEGVRGLYRGIAPNFLKVAPAVSISYVVYEKAKGQLGIV